MRGLINHLGWKLLAFAAACTLWYLFVGQTELATSIPVVVQYRNIPGDLEITADPPDRLHLKLRGPVSRLSAGELARTVLVLDLKNTHGPGEQTINIGEEQLGLPSGVSLVRAVPSQVRVTLDKRAERDVPVEVRYTGPPASGYRLVSQKVFPEKVRIVGPEPFVARVDSAPTDAIDLSGTVGNAEFRVPVFLTDPHLRFGGAAPIVTVVVTLEKIPQS